MRHGHVIPLAGLVLMSVFALSIGYEFAFEDVFWPFILADYEGESLHDRWEYIITATCFSGIALIIPTLILRRTLVERERTAIELEERVRERTAELQEVNGALRNEIAERERAEEQLFQAQRMEAVGKLTGGVAHEFNNLLHAVIGFLNLLGKEIGEDEESRSLLEGARSAAWRGADIAKNLLAFGRRQTLRPQAIDLNEVVSNALDMFRGTLGEAIEVKLVLPPHIWEAVVDRGHMESALFNLALNARDAMPNGGTITIKTDNAHMDENAVTDISEAEPGDYVRLAVTDDGIGMPPEVAAHAFEPFFTTKDVGEGTGLGLSMVYGFAQQSKGFVRIDTTLGGGTRVELYMPRAPEARA